ncbi:MAG: ASCH domain-containing protein [Clostridiales bacterium]|nr:ASCH domain-containing protein [Clostridiales bacterium]
MEHIMRLNPVPFELVKTGRKSIELRLYDEKRKAVKTGDYICFVNSRNMTESLRVLVEKIYVFGSFEELYENLPLDECGYEEKKISSAAASDMNKYYSREKQHKYGVVGIKFSPAEQKVQALS